jgi:hypothetical protein
VTGGAASHGAPAMLHAAAGAGLLGPGPSQGHHLPGHTCLWLEGARPLAPAASACARRCSRAERGYGVLRCGAGLCLLVDIQGARPGDGVRAPGPVCKCWRRRGVGLQRVRCHLDPGHQLIGKASCLLSVEDPARALQLANPGLPSTHKTTADMLCAMGSGWRKVQHSGAWHDALRCTELRLVVIICYLHLVAIIYLQPWVGISSSPRSCKQAACWCVAHGG